MGIPFTFGPCLRSEKGEPEEEKTSKLEEVNCKLLENSKQRETRSSSSSVAFSVVAANERANNGRTACGVLQGSFRSPSTLRADSCQIASLKANLSL